MTDHQFHVFLEVMGIQLGLIIGCFAALLVIIVNTGRRRDD